MAPMKKRRLALVIVLLVAVNAFGLAGRAALERRCSKRVAYRGAPLYAKTVELPRPDFRWGGEFSAETRAKLETAAAEARKLTGAQAMTLAVGGERGFYSMSDGKRLYWASVGKSFTATAVLQLVEEGTLRLDEPIARWFPRFPNASLITIDDLLLHTAGIFSANEDPEARKSPRYRSPEESRDIAVRHGPLFCPGEAWRYSNTGYTMLGEILVAVEKKPYPQILDERIFRPLGLASLRAVAPGDPLADVAPLRPKDGSEPAISPSWAGAAGSVVGDASDMLRFWHALLTGKLLPLEATARRFARLYPMFDSGTYYGQGVMVYDVPGVLWLGHSGGTPGAKAVVAYSPPDRAFVAVALDTDAPAEAIANLLFKALREEASTPAGKDPHEQNPKR